jgi:hypothetical protein
VNGKRNKEISRCKLVDCVFLFTCTLLVLELTIGPSFINLSYSLKVIQNELVKYENDFFHVVGIVQNDENKTIDNIYAIATLIGKDNSILGNYSNQVEVHPLKPSETTPFDITIYDRNKNDQIKNYSTLFKFTSTSAETHRDLEIHSVNSRSDMLGFYFIHGRITNNMNIISNNTVVIATVLDKDHNLLGVWKAQTEPYNVPPLGSASFTIPVTDNFQVSRITNYTLFVNNS